jgi:nucleoside-diphosphate-sugar epimerase
MRALVMGGNRYIGLSLVEELVRRGHEVTVMNSHEAPLPPGVRRLHGDRRIAGTITHTLGPHRDEFDIVYDNTAYTVSDLEPMVELFTGRVRHFVFTSSSAVYRRSLVQPVTESSSTHDPADDAPAKAYGVGKVRCEQFLQRLHEEHGLPVTVLRVGHTLGPRSPLATRDPGFFARLERRRPILIPGDGFPFIQLVHVADVASLMASIPGNDRAAGRTYNVFGNEFASLVNLVRIMARVAGVEPRIVHVPLEAARHLRPPLVHWGEAVMGGAVFSIERALTELDWRPAFGLESGYRDSWEWYRTEGRARYGPELDELLAHDDTVLSRLGLGPDGGDA